MFLGRPGGSIYVLYSRGTGQTELYSRPVPRISVSYDHGQVRAFARAYTLLHTAKPVFGRSPARAEVDFAAPVLFIWRAFGLPVKRVRSDFRKCPAHRAAPGIWAFLHDVLTPCLPNLLCEKICRWIVPQDAPGGQIWIVNAQR